MFKTLERILKYKHYLKYEDNSHLEILDRKIVPFELITKAKVTLLENEEELLLNWITITKFRMQQLVDDLDIVTLGEIAPENHFSSILIIQNSPSDVLKDELNNGMKNMGA